MGAHSKVTLRAGERVTLWRILPRGDNGDNLCCRDGYLLSHFGCQGGASPKFLLYPTTYSELPQSVHPWLQHKECKGLPSPAHQVALFSTAVKKSWKKVKKSAKNKKAAKVWRLTAILTLLGTQLVLYNLYLYMFIGACTLLSRSPVLLFWPHTKKIVLHPYSSIF